MKRCFWPLQFLVTMLVSTLIQDNVLKVVMLMVFWGFSFYPIAKKEIFYFVLCSIVFTASNYGALKNFAFEFSKKDILLMPYNELIMWGFYCLNAHRYIPTGEQEQISFTRFLIYAGAFAVSFSLVQAEVWLCLILTLLMGWALFNFRRQRVFRYIGYFLLMGVVVESTGLFFQLWHYPNAEHLPFPLWAPLMWGNIGLIMSLITNQFLQSSRSALPLAEASPSGE